ncbi:SGNH/GDSL hydrolase family protein [Mucilaginibacter paludis]|uniref:Lipolytic protein G-D-S-L family n=1 Tax=Mucilaginibacter paludis DSM 18603 TaxID=714943 RepID=H1Y4Y7_9SPHI|nr:SGNH/GDSL hydrolase family protein [Mucilaginibacter paludis]EHQ28315.1 lipolytic protein G-D-S-L family [Mucilaginibacter paludis DSM 18603]
MKTYLWLLMSLAAFTSGAKKTTKMQTENLASVIKPEPQAHYTYLALGDSYTIGEAVKQSESFPYQLKNKLAKQGINIAAPDVIAVTGWTTGDLKEGIAQAHISQKYNLVTLLIGVNNQYRGYSQSEYHTEFVQLLNTAIAFAGGDKHKVFVLSIPDYSVTPFAQNSDKSRIATEIDQFNAINQHESIKAGVNYLAITDISRRATHDAALVASDGLHPSAKMYSEWVERLAPMVAEKLK